MKICYVVETFSVGLGYIDNILPEEFANLGHSVHVITTDLPPYYQFGTQHVIPNDVLNPKSLQTKFYLHKHEVKKIGKRIVLIDVNKTISKLKPDVVVVRGLASPVLLQIVLSKFSNRFKLYTSSGMAMSHVPFEIKKESKFNSKKLIHFLTRFVPGRILSYFINGCIASTHDCVDVAVSFYGVPRTKTKMIPLGVSTELFHPIKTEKDLMERNNIRDVLGFKVDDFICVWSGRMTSNKGIEILAQAVEELANEGINIRALFIGNGEVADTLDKYNFSKRIDFIRWDSLPAFYRACDISVWPKSISTSTLDAASSGLPVIMSNKELAVERWQGFGSDYIEGSISDLKSKLTLFLDKAYLSDMSARANDEMNEKYSWSVIANKFIDHFES